MALETIHAMQESLGRKLKVDWVAPRRHLLGQVMQANMELHRDMIRPVSMFEKHPPEADMVVLDEAHHEATQSCVLLYEKMKARYTLGLSATPMRTDRMKLSFQETVTTCSIDRLIREGFLSPFHSYILPNYGPQAVGECYLNSPETWGKSIAFFHTVLECHRFQKVLAAGGVACEVVTSESDKDRQFEDFLSGKVRVIANVSMLTEGFDHPDVQTVFARDASRLPTIQMCGRGLRRAEGKEFCNIVQSAKTPYLFERVHTSAAAVQADERAVDVVSGRDKVDRRYAQGESCLARAPRANTCPSQVAQENSRLNRPLHRRVVWPRGVRK